MPDKRLSEYAEVVEASGDFLIPVLEPSGNTYLNKNISVQNFLSNLGANTFVDAPMTAGNGLLVNGDDLVANSGALLRGESYIYNLNVANTQIHLANTYTPSSSDVSAVFPSGVMIFFDANYIYVSVNGVAKRAALSSF